MRTINVNEIIDNSKFNSFYLWTFLICLLIRTLDGYEINMIGTVIPAIIKDGQLTTTQVGLIASMSLYGMIFGSIIFGMLADKIGKVRVLMISVFFYAFFSGMCGFATSYTEFMIYRFVAGLGMAGCLPVITAHISEFSPLKVRATMVSTATLGQAIGAQLATGAALLFMSYMGWHWRSMFYVGFLPLLIIPIIYFYLGDSIGYLLKKGDKSAVAKILAKADPTYVAQEDDEYKIKTFPDNKASFSSLFKHGLAMNTILLWGLIFVDLFIIYGLSVWIPKLMMTQGYSFNSSVAMMGVWFLGPFVGVPLLGALVDKFGYRPVLMCCYLSVAILFSIFSFTPSFWILVIVLFLAGAGVHGTQGIASAYVCACYPVAIRGTAFGTASGLGRFGASVGATMGGILIAWQFSFQSIILVWAVAALVGCLATFLSREYSKAEIFAKTPSQSK
jgi:AAHS family benzoate transporter-like MFS transporter